MHKVERLYRNQSCDEIQKNLCNVGNHRLLVNFHGREARLIIRLLIISEKFLLHVQFAAARPARVFGSRPTRARRSTGDRATFGRWHGVHDHLPG
jgi:hypothetical protein